MPFAPKLPESVGFVLLKSCQRPAVADLFDGKGTGVAHQPIPPAFSPIDRPPLEDFQPPEFSIEAGFKDPVFLKNQRNARIII